jgi:hypothetical protein
MLASATAAIDFVSDQFYSHGPYPLSNPDAQLANIFDTVVADVGSVSKTVVGMAIAPADSINAKYAVPTGKGACTDQERHRWVVVEERCRVHEGAVVQCSLHIQHQMNS